MRHEVEISNASSGLATIGAAAFLVIAFPALLFALAYLLLFAGSAGLGLAGITIELFTKVESRIPVIGETGLGIGFSLLGAFGGYGIGLLAFFLFPRAHWMFAPLYFIVTFLALAMSAWMFANWHLDAVVGDWAKYAESTGVGLTCVLIAGIGRYRKLSASKNSTA